jgi:hypothetical protein
LLYDRHRVETDLLEMQCDKLRAFEISSAVSEIVATAEFNKTAYMIVYQPNLIDVEIAIDILHYNSKPPAVENMDELKEIDNTDRSYLMARSLVKELGFIYGYPKNGFTVHLVANARREKIGELLDANSKYENQ